MRSVVAALAFVYLSFGHPADRVFQFHTAQSDQEMQEIATVVKAIGDIRDTSVDTDARRLSVRGSDAQLAQADWLFNELDKAPDTLAHEYRVPEGPENVVRLYYLPASLTLQDFQEISTLVRHITEIRRAYTYNTPRALVVRGTPEQMLVASWLLQQLTGEPTGSRFPVPETSDDLVRVLLVPNAATVQQLQEIATLVRSIGDIRQLFTYQRARAIAIRGTSQQLALAEWLTQELDGPSAPHAASPEYLLPAQTEGVVKVFYLPKSDSLQSFQQAATFIRTTTQIRRAFTYNAPRALALRGTPSQIADAERLIQERK